LHPDAARPRHALGQPPRRPRRPGAPADGEGPGADAVGLEGASVRLAGKVALITGAGAGIGRAAALLFAREGARVAAADLDSGTGRETVEQVQAAGGEAIFVRVDVAAADSVRAA